MRRRPVTHNTLFTPLNITLGIVAFLLLLAVLRAAYVHFTPQPAANTTQAYTAPLMDVQGQGTMNTKSVNVPAAWSLNWKCTPTNGDEYSLQVNIHYSDGTDVEAINDNCMFGHSSGSAPQTKPGLIYLEVYAPTQEQWSISVTA